MWRTRPLTQAAFLAFVLVSVFWIGGNAELWCPFGGVESLYTYVTAGALPCSLGVSNLYILIAVLALALLVRRAFCSHACPIGTLSEWLQRGAARLGLRPWSVPQRLERVLALIPYAVLAVILYLTYRAGELVFRGYDPCYALISRHGEDITHWAYVAAGAIVLGSLLVTLPFCRWLCPLAAVLHPFSRFGVARIRRDPATCTDCRRCTRACPMAIPVHERSDVREARCTSCFECIRACPERAERALTWGPPGTRRRAWPHAVLLALLLAGLGGAAAMTYAVPRAAFVHERGALPAATEQVDLRVGELTCRGRATLLAFFLDRGDLYALPGYLKLEVWPDPDRGRARVTFDPARIDGAKIRRAITEPYYDPAGDRWLVSPFTISGYNPLDLTE